MTMLRWYEWVSIALAFSVFLLIGLGEVYASLIPAGVLFFFYLAMMEDHNV